MIKPELKLLIRSTIFPILFIVLLWLIWGIDELYNLNLTQYGIQPLTPKGLIGVFMAPLLHGNIEHLISNSIPLFILGTGLFYYYKNYSFKIFLMSYFMTGIWTWFMARGIGIHIGASGIVNALITFHLTSALLRKRKDIAAFSLVIIFLYGSFVWGFFPDFYPTQNISWESHLCGAIAGIVVAFYYRDIGPQKVEWVWDDDDDNDDEENNENDTNVKECEDIKGNNNKDAANRGNCYFNSTWTLNDSEVKVNVYYKLQDKSKNKKDDADKKT